MRTIYFCLAMLLAVCLKSAAQEYNRFYLDSAFVSTDSGKHTYFRVISKDSMANWYRSKTYYKSGQLQEDVRSSTPKGGFYDGSKLQYWENGNLKQKSEFIERREMGQVQTWYENGKPQSIGQWEDASGTGSKHDFILSDFWDENGRQTVLNGKGRYSKSDKNFHEEGEIENGLRSGIWTGRIFRYGLSFDERYEKGEFVSGKSTDASNKRYEYSEIDEKPVFKNGTDAISKYIAANFRNPSDKAQSGRMLAMFTIAPSGKVREVVIKRSVGKNADAEAIRVVSGMPPWKPARHRGMPVEKSMLMPIVI